MTGFGENGTARASSTTTSLEAFEKLAARTSWPVAPPFPDVPIAGRPTKGIELAVAALDGTQDPIVVEVGAEFGGSTRTWMDARPDCRVVSIDPWPTPYRARAWREMVDMVGSDVETIELFMNFCWPYRDRLAPLRGVTPGGLVELHDLGLTPSLVYIDGDHRYEAVMRDIAVADGLFPDAIICGDDWLFDPKGKKYRGMPVPVQRAVVDYCNFAQYGVDVRANTWVIHREDNALIPPIRRVAPSPQARGAADLGRRLSAIESRIEEIDVQRVRRLRRIEAKLDAMTSSTSGSVGGRLGAAVRRSLRRLRT